MAKNMKENGGEFLSKKRFTGGIENTDPLEINKALFGNTLREAAPKNAGGKKKESYNKKEQKDAKKFVDEVQSKQEHITVAMKEWNEANKHKAVESLDKVQKKLDAALKLSPEIASWSGIADAKKIEYSAVAAEYLYTIAKLPKDFAEDPNVVFQYTARFAASMSESGLARGEETNILNKAILHIRELREKHPAAGFTLNNEDLTYTLRGFVLYDKQLDQGILARGQKETDAFLQEVQDTIRVRKSTSFDEERKYLQRWGDNVAKGEYKAIDNDDKHAAKTYKIEDKDNLQPFVDRINRRVVELEQLNKTQRQAEYDSRAFHQSFEGQTVTTGKELNDLVESRLMRYAGARKAATEHYRSLSDEEKKEYKFGVVRAIRERMELLEQNPDPWRIGGIDPLPMELQQELLLLQDLGDHELYEKTHLEAESRAWLHVLNETLKKGASPTDTKELMHAQGEFDKMEMQEAIVKIPGLSETMKMLDARYEKIMASETDPLRKNEEFEKILFELKNKPEICNTAVTGMTPEAVLELAKRHFYETGRDAAWYRFYIRKHHLIGYTTDKKTGIVKGYVDPSAPLLWNPYRLLYCPEAMWTFFNFGANLEGEMGSFVMPNGKKLEMRFAQGVGADVMKSLFDNGFDLKLQDYYSRRKDYNLDAWIAEQIDKNQDNPQLRAIWESGELRRTGQGDDVVAWSSHQHELMEKDPILGKLRMAQRDEIRLSYNVKFAKEFGVNAWTAHSPEKEEKYLKNLNSLLKEAKHHHRDEVVTEVQALADRYKASLAQAREFNTNFKNTVCEENHIALDEYDKVFGDFFPSLSKFNVDQIPYMRVARLQENKRGNFRDHINGLTVLGQVGDFVRYPSTENLLKVDHNAMCAYTKYIDAQKNLILPAYLAFTDVQKGKGIFGSEMIGFIDVWKSKFSKAYDQKTLTELELYKICRVLVGKGALTRDILFKTRGGLLGLVRDKTLQYADPLTLIVLSTALLKEEAEKLKKDVEKG